FFDAAMRRLELRIVANEDALARWPKTGPLVVVANHPFAALDGLIICHLVSKVRSDFRVLTNSVLHRAEEVRTFLLPVDFADTQAALQTNLRTRAEAKLHLTKGGCLIVFPAGGVSTTPSLWHSRAVDAPVFFAGQNSRLFQLASHVSMTLRLSLLFKEIHDRIGTAVHVRVGDVIACDTLPSERQLFMRALRERTYALEREV